MNIPKIAEQFLVQNRKNILTVNQVQIYICRLLRRQNERINWENKEDLVSYVLTTKFFI